MDWASIITVAISAVAGGGIWNVISAKIQKQKTPYDMLMEMLAEQKHFYEEKNRELEKEKEDSAEKSFIISQSRKCSAKKENPSLICPIEEANDMRLKGKCKECKTKTE